VVKSQLTTFTFCENPCFNTDVPRRRQVLPLGELSDYEKTRLEEVKAMDVGVMSQASENLGFCSCYLLGMGWYAYASGLRVIKDD
jgi:hypothetical protein